MDNFCNSSPSVAGKLEMLTGHAIAVAELDLMDAAGLASLFETSRPTAVIHCAGLKAVGESVAHPLMYYEQNIGGTINLLKQMDKVACKRIVFSSSATVMAPPAHRHSTSRPDRPPTLWQDQPSRTSSATGVPPAKAARRCCGISIPSVPMNQG